MRAEAYMSKEKSPEFELEKELSLKIKSIDRIGPRLLADDDLRSCNHDQG